MIFLQVSTCLDESCLVRTRDFRIDEYRSIIGIDKRMQAMPERQRKLRAHKARIKREYWG